MAVSGEKTGRRHYAAEQRIMAIAAMMRQNRRGKGAAFQSSWRRDRLGRFMASAVQGQAPSLVCIAKQIAAEHGISVNTAWRWYALYRRGGYGALGRKRRTDATTSAFFRRHPLWEPFIAEALSSGKSACALARNLGRMSPDAPSYATIRTYARHGYSDRKYPAKAIANPAVTR